MIKFKCLNDISEFCGLIQPMVVIICHPDEKSIGAAIFQRCTLDGLDTKLTESVFFEKSVCRTGVMAGIRHQSEKVQGDHLLSDRSYRSSLSFDVSIILYPVM